MGGSTLHLHIGVYVGLHIWHIISGIEVHCHIQKVHNFPAGLNSNLKIVFFECLACKCPSLLSGFSAVFH